MVADSCFLDWELPESERDFEIIETHISYVILTSRWAYKIKRSLSLPFLDFSQLEQRYHFCQKELALNQRLAPQMYLSVLPVKKSNHQIYIGSGSGDTVDYALKMKRMDNALEMDRMLLTRTVNANHIGDLAAYLADFHAQATVVFPNYSLQYFQHLFNPIADLFPYFQQYLGSKYSTIVEKAIQTSDQFLKSNMELLIQRQELGLVRELHGDLHSKNIFLSQPPIIFDCIEFDNALRQIDVLDEVAFLAMDLEAFGYFSLAQILYRQYLNRMASYQITQVDHSQLFTYYKMYRANVRAKVLAFQAQKSNQAKKIRKEAKGYLDLMGQYSTQLL